MHNFKPKNQSQVWFLKEPNYTFSFLKKRAPCCVAQANLEFLGSLNPNFRALSGLTMVCV